MPPLPPPRRQTTPQTLRLVRLALLLGPVLIGAVFAFLTMQTGPFLDDAATLETLRLAFIGVAVLAAVGVFLIQGRRARADTFQRQATLCIAGWVLAESAATLGAVYLLLSGSGLVFLIGLLVLGLAFLLLPIPESVEG